MTEVFISYASEDREIAGALAALMRAAGLSVWWDRDSLHAGDSLPASLSKAARQARVVVVLWSKATAGSEWVPFEVGTNAKVVVVRLDGHVALPEPLRDRLAVEVELGPDGSPAGGLAKLIEAVRRIASPLLIRLRRRLLPFAAGIVGTGFLWWSFSGGDQGFESRLYFIRMEKEPDSTRRMSVRRAYVTRSIRPRTYGQIL